MRRQSNSGWCAVDRPVEEALMVARRATFDPGQFTKRVRYDEQEVETLEWWQARAVLVALAEHAPDARWAIGNGLGPHITACERAEFERLGLTDATDAAAFAEKEE